MRDPNARQPRKFGGQTIVRSGGSQAPGAKLPPIPPELLCSLNDDDTPDLKAL